MAQAVLRKYAILNTFSFPFLWKSNALNFNSYISLSFFFFVFLSYRVKKRSDLIGAFKLEPLYLQHHHQESGNFIVKYNYHYFICMLIFNIKKWFKMTTEILKTS